MPNFAPPLTLFRRTTRIPVKHEKIALPAIDETSRADGSRTGGISTSWVGEGGATTATKPKFRKMTLLPNKLLGLAYPSNELLRDSTALGPWLGRKFGEEAAFIIEVAMIHGSGSGLPLGILNSNALITTSKESGQAASTLVTANLANMVARMWGPSRRSAIWLLCNDALAQVEDSSFSNGMPVVQYDIDGNPRILGCSVILDEYTSALGSVGDVILMDPSQYLIGEKEPQIASSIHVRFVEDESVFRFRFRVDGKPLGLRP